MIGLRTLVFGGSLLLALAACNEGAGYTPPGPRPEIVGVEGPCRKCGEASGTPEFNTTTYDPKESGGACPIQIKVQFRLPEDQFVSKAYVRFQGDGSEQGVERPYLFDSYVYGQGGAPQAVTINAYVPSTIVRMNATFSYSFRIVSGAGESSDPVTLPLNVRQPEEPAETKN